MRLSAPGKLILAGEYSVIEGGLGLVSATKQRAVVDFEPGSAEQFNTQQGTELPMAVFSCARTMGMQVPTGTWKLDTSQLMRDRTHKLGLGSSSALTVALCKHIIVHNLGLQDLQATYKLALQAHREFSHPLSSGIDITASCFGGIQLFKKHSSAELPSHTRTKLQISKQELLVVYTGSPQSTKSYLDAILPFSRAKNPEYRQIIRCLGYENRELINVLTTKSPTTRHTRIGLHVARINQLLDQLGKLVGIAIRNDAIRHIDDVARQFGGAAKPSGAGGGDIALCFVPCEEQAPLRAKLDAHGYTCISTF